MRRQALFGALGIIVASPALAQTDAYCRRFENLMQPGQLYQAKCTDRDDCLSPVPMSGLAIRKDNNHRLVYRTEATPVRNSLVVVQLKYVGISPQARPSKVALSRQTIDFGCYRRSQSLVHPAISAKPEEMDKAPEVSYENYDQFHRYGYSASADRSMLTDFHVRYFNGESCVRTMDVQRRAQFLFEDRSNLPGYWATVWRRSGLQDLISPVVADPNAPILKYQRLHVVLSNYRKQPDASGCFSFAVQGKGSAVEVAMSDVEQNVRDGNVAQRTWILDVY